MQNSKNVVKMPSTSTLKRSFQTDIKKVLITLPVNFNIEETKRIQISLIMSNDLTFDYFYDYLPNVDINCYIQFAAQQYTHECSKVASSQSVDSASKK